MSKQPMSVAERVRRNTSRREAAGMRQIKVWIAAQADDTDESEAARVRMYAAKLPLTRIAIRRFKEML